MKRFYAIPTILLIATLLLLVGCDDGGNAPTDENDFQAQQQDLVNQYMAQLTAARPYPLAQMTDSLELKQITEKLLRFNDPNKISYAYRLNMLGEVIDYQVVQGKVSSNQSQMTTTTQVKCYKEDIDDTCVTTDSPGDDGSFGLNEPGIFFFNTDGILIQWGLTVTDYQLSDAPMQIDENNHLIYIVGSEPSSSYLIESTEEEAPSTPAP